MRPSFRLTASHQPLKPRRRVSARPHQRTGTRTGRRARIVHRRAEDNHRPSWSLNARPWRRTASAARVLPSLPQSILWRYACFVTIVSGVYLLYTHLPYYQGPQFAAARLVLGLLYVAYLVGGIPFYLVPLLATPRARYDVGSKTLLYLALCRQAMSRGGIGRARPRWRFSNRRTKTALLSLGVKGFYLPIMTMYVCRHVTNLAAHFASFRASVDFSSWLSASWYELTLALLFFVDTAVFTMSYAIESPRFGSRIKSVEPTLLGCVAALICYPPFNSLVSANVVPGELMRATPWFAHPILLGGSRVIVIVCDAIFVWASVTLGFRASNLTNRGIVSWGPYRWVRHPAYTVKLVSFWCEQLPSLTWAGAFVLGFWHVIYFLRAWTEERHLSRDPDYQRYVQAVRCRFIPRVW